MMIIIMRDNTKSARRTKLSKSWIRKELILVITLVQNMLISWKIEEKRMTREQRNRQNAMAVKEEAVEEEIEAAEVVEEREVDEDEAEEREAVEEVGVEEMIMNKRKLSQQKRDQLQPKKEAVLDSLASKAAKRSWLPYSLFSRNSLHES